MYRKIRVTETKDGKFIFQPIAKNGEPQATSEPYESKSNAERGARDLFPSDFLDFTEPDDKETD